VPASSIGRLLAADPGLQPVLERARRIGALSKTCLDFLPPEIARGIRGLSLRDDRLVVLAATSAAAAKVKLVAESLCKFLLDQGEKVNGVSVRVQPEARAADTAPHKLARLSPASLAALRRLHRRLSDSPARAALKTLLDHQLKPARAGRARRRREAPPPRARR